MIAGDEPMARNNYVCSTCGSENVRPDAWAVWNIETQSWELSTVFDAGFCDDCDDGASLDEVEIVSGENATIDALDASNDCRAQADGPGLR